FTLLSVLGVVLTTTGGFGSFSFAGLLFLLGSTVSAAAFTVISRKISVHFSAFERTYVMFALGAVVFTAMALWETRGNPSAWLVPFSRPKFLLSALYLAVLSSVCAFMLINYTVNYLSAGHTSIMSNFTTVVSVLAGVLILRESFTPLQFLGVAVIILSVLGVSWQQSLLLKKANNSNT
ncbi:MAG: DMT family transporter, partial [Oscillospiraceae bacterium]|nr:DMT family transporter [Oscillospiraceae bacterium]